MLKSLSAEDIELKTDFVDSKQIICDNIVQIHKHFASIKLTFRFTGLQPLADKEVKKHKDVKMNK